MPVPRIVPVLALTSALVSAGATIFIRQGLRTSGPLTGFWINLVMGVVALWAAVALTGGPGPVSAKAFAYFVLAGLLGTVAGRLFRFLAIDRVGASVATALINLNPMIATILAIVLLGERVTAPIVIGTLVIVAGTTLLSLSGQHLGFRPRLLWLPILSATCFGMVSILRKLGLGGAGPIIGTALNVTTAAVAFGAFMLATGQRDALIARGRPLLYFAAAGFMENTAVFLNIVALGMGTVSVVTPLYGTSPIFVLLLSFFFLRGVEVLTARVVTGTVLIVLGIYLISALAGR
jgi:drug/metabolite transporter (DMT)-like permease